MTKDDYVEYVKSAFISIGRKGVMSALVTYIPVFSNPFLYKCAEYLVNKGVEVLVNLGEMQVFFWYTDFRVAEQSKDFIEAALANKKAQESGTLEEKKIAEQNLINTFRTFIKFSG